MNPRNHYITLALAIAFSFALSGVAAAQAFGPPVPLGQQFCSNNTGNGTYMPPNQNPDGSSGNLGLNGMTASGNASSISMGGCMNSGAQDGTFSWDMRHAQATLASGGTGTDGTEHGTFKFNGNDGTIADGIFNGQIVAFISSFCTGNTAATSCQSGTVYQSMGNYNSINNNGPLGLNSNTHVNGGYSLTVSEMPNMMSSNPPCSCSFSASLD